MDAAPTVKDDVIYIGSQDDNLYAIPISSKTPKWSYDAEGSITGGAAVTDDMVFVTTLAGHVHGVDRNTGNQLWRFTTDGRVWSGPAFADGKVFAGSEDDSVYALDEGTGSLVWQFDTGGDVVGGPTHANGTVYVTSYDDFVYALNAGDGELRWKSELQNGSLSSPTIADGMVFVGSWDDHVYALDEHSGALLWNFWTGDATLTAITHAGSTVYAGSDDGHMYALDAKDGSLKWRFQTGGKARSTPVVNNDVLYFGSDDDQLYALDSRTGIEIWRFETGDDVMASPTVHKDTVYIGSHDNQLYALATATIGAVVQDLPDPSTTTPTFALLSPQELIERLDFAFATSLNVESVATVHDSDGSTEVRQSYSDEVIEIFENGYFLLTGASPKAEGWIPRIFPGEDYIAFIDDFKGGSSFLKSALGFCCERAQGGLELIIRGDQLVSSTVATVSHEAGHARQRIANPVQSKAIPGANLDALQEAEAFAFEVAVARKIGEYTGVATSVFPDFPGIRAYVDGWREFVRESLDDPSEIHNRGRLFMWLAVLHDPALTDLKTELIDNSTLSADSMLKLHNRLTQLAPSEVDPYVESITGSVSDDLNFILGTIDKRIGHFVQYVELSLNVPELTLSP
ncbi:MAG: PQQ-binding-like beta-propeller repeat protein [SAR202 cluster bacterium]|nr:PQQ-binding-like beta-propeller repeat protein [SAR202 cluster bacterium]